MRRGDTGAQLAGAVMLGMATLLEAKPDPREHWATPPRTRVVAAQENPADPDETLDDIDLAFLLVDSA
jgi:hypothetical protein